MGLKYQRQQGENMPAFRERCAASERVQRPQTVYQKRRFKQQENEFRNLAADRIDGYDRDDLGLSKD